MRLLTWLGSGLILAVLLVDLALVAWLSGRTMLELFVDVGGMVVGLLRAATMGAG